MAKNGEGRRRFIIFAVVNFGTLHLPVSQPAAPIGAAWVDVPEHAWILIGSALLVLFIIPELYKLMPAMVGCLLRSRGNLEVEHSISTARSRNVCARLLAVPFLVAIDRYCLYDADFLAGWGEPWLRLGELAAVVVAVLIFRLILHALLLGRRLRLDAESNKAITRGILNYFISFAILMMLSISILYMFKASDEAIRLVISGELAVFWLLSVVREGQILQQKCGVFATFLYLCGLELLPAGALIASALIF